MGDAVSKGADVIVTGAGWHSNWCTQVIAACRRLGLDVIIYKQAVEDGYDPEDYDWKPPVALYFRSEELRCGSSLEREGIED